MLLHLLGIYSIENKTELGAQSYVGGTEGGYQNCDIKKYNSIIHYASLFVGYWQYRGVSLSSHPPHYNGHIKSVSGHNIKAAWFGIMVLILTAEFVCSLVAN